MYCGPLQCILQPRTSQVCSALLHLGPDSIHQINCIYYPLNSSITPLRADTSAVWAVWGGEREKKVWWPYWRLYRRQNFFIFLWEKPSGSLTRIDLKQSWRQRGANPQAEYKIRTGLEPEPDRHTDKQTDWQTEPWCFGQLLCHGDNTNPDQHIKL